MCPPISLSEAESSLPSLQPEPSCFPACRESCRKRDEDGDPLFPKLLGEPQCLYGLMPQGLQQTPSGCRACVLNIARCLDRDLRCTCHYDLELSRGPIYSNKQMYTPCLLTPFLPTRLGHSILPAWKSLLISLFRPVFSQHLMRTYCVLGPKDSKKNKLRSSRGSWARTRVLKYRVAGTTMAWCPGPCDARASLRGGGASERRRSSGMVPTS